MNDAGDVHEPTAPAAAHTKLPARDRRLLIGLALPPSAWSLHLFVAYGLVYPSARLGSKRWLVVVTVACLGLALLGAVLAALSGRVRPHERELGEPGSPAEHARALALPPNHAAAREERARFVALAGAVLGLFFAAVIVAQSVPIALVALGDP
jgi:hypothetical protein